MGNNLSWEDLTIFILMLLVSASIGIYYGFIKKKQNTIQEYMYAGGDMYVIPVCLSNMASNISSITLAATPKEAYYYGAQLLFIPLGELTAAIFLYNFFLPVFFNLRYFSLFEYLEKRFNKFTRYMGSIVYTFTQVEGGCDICHYVTITLSFRVALAFTNTDFIVTNSSATNYLGLYIIYTSSTNWRLDRREMPFIKLFYVLVIVYTSCSAISEVLGIPFYIFTPTACLFCTFYTALGGLSGVVWTDCLQATYMYISLLALVLLGIRKAGSVDQVIKVAQQGGRLDIFNFDPSPFARNSAWTLYISEILMTMVNTCTSPGIMQRYLSLSSYFKAKVIVIISCLASMLVMVLAVSLGIVIYASYHDCDPVMSKKLSDPNQLVAYFVMELGYLPGLPGLFIAGLLSAAFSSMSTIMNAFSGTVYEDLIKPCLRKKLNDAQTNLCIKCVVFVFGFIISIGILFLDASGGTFQLYRTMTGLTNGMIIFIFAFGIFFRKANAKGVIFGALAGGIITLWIGMGSQAAISSGKVHYSTKVISIEGCPTNLTQSLGYNSTTFGYKGSTPVFFDEEVPYPYRISFNLISVIGVTTSFLVGIVISTITATSNHRVTNDLLIPQLRVKLPRKVTSGSCY